jgi:hypothetical protein
VGDEEEEADADEDGDAEVDEDGGMIDLVSFL